MLTGNIMQYCLVLLCFICGCSNNHASAMHFRGGSGVSSSSSSTVQQQHQHHGNASSLRRRRVMGDKREEEEEDDDENDNVFVLPTDAPSSPLVAATAAPTVALTFITENDDSSSANTTPITENSDNENVVTQSLIAFMIEIQGEALLDSAGETVFRFHLQQYLLEFLQSPYLQVSNILEGIQLDRPWAVTTPATRRQLQDDTTTTTSSNATNLILQYQGKALLKETAGFWDSQPTEDLIYEAQIVALEDTVALQQYFIDLFLNSAQEAVIFVRLQVGNRPRVQWDPEETWDRIAALNATQPQQEQEDEQQQQNEQQQQEQQENAANDNEASMQATWDGLSSGIIVLIVCMVALVIIACVAVACLLRIKKHRQAGSLRKLPGAPDIHAMEVVSEVDSEENEDIIYDKSLLRNSKNNSPTMTRTSSWDEGDDDGNSNGSSGKGSLRGSRISLKRVSSLFRKSTPTDEIEVCDDGVIGPPPVSRAGSNATSTSRSSRRKDAEENMEIFPHTSVRGISSPVIDLTAPGRNSSGIEVYQQEAPKPGTQTIVRSPRQRKASQEDHDEFDSVMEKMNMKLYSNQSFDDESMMGYSLASADTGYKHNAATSNNSYSHQQQLNVSQESEITMFTMDGEMAQNQSQEVPAPDDLARQSSDGDSSNGSEPSNNNSMLPGVQNLLNNSKPPKSKSKKWYRSGRKNRLMGIISSDSESVNTLEHVLEEASAQSDSSGSSVFIDDDAESVEVGLVLPENDENLLPSNPETDDEAASSYKEVDSVVSRDSSVDADALSDVNDAAALSALGFYKREEGGNVSLQLNILPQITPVPSEERDEMVLQAPIINNAGLGSMSAAAIPDNVSDAPSDERINNLATLAVQSSLMDPRGSVTSIDNDPAVVDYLTEQRRSMKQRTRRKRADRKQSPVTMEV